MIAAEGEQKASRLAFRHYSNSNTEKSENNSTFYRIGILTIFLEFVKAMTTLKLLVDQSLFRANILTRLLVN